MGWGELEHTSPICAGILAHPGLMQVTIASVSSWMWSPWQSRTSLFMALVIPPLWSSPAVVVVVVVVYRRVSHWGLSLCLSLPWGDVFLGCFLQEESLPLFLSWLSFKYSKVFGDAGYSLWGRNLLLLDSDTDSVDVIVLPESEKDMGLASVSRLVTSLSLSAWDNRVRSFAHTFAGRCGCRGLSPCFHLLCFIISQNFLKWWHLPPGLRGLFHTCLNCFSVLECW